MARNVLNIMQFFGKFGQPGRLARPPTGNPGSGPAELDLLGWVVPGFSLLTSPGPKISRFGRENLDPTIKRGTLTKRLNPPKTAGVITSLVVFETQNSAQLSLLTVTSIT